MKQLEHLGALLSVATLLAACGSSDDEAANQGASCQPGVMTSCACSDGTFGTQTCDASGAYTTCTACGNSEPVAPEPGPGPTGEPLPIVDNPMGHPDCGNDPSVQPSPCIDAWGAVRCKTNSGYPGDELALCDLGADEGLLLHFGPSDYDNPAEVAPYLLAPGDEQEFCKYINTTNTVERFTNAYHGRMRPNSHHLIVTMPPSHEASPVPFTCGPQILDRWLFGSQDPQIDVAAFGGGVNPAEVGDPDYGLALAIPPNQTLMFDFHNINTSDQMELREAWATFSYIDQADVVTTGDMLAMYQLAIDIPPMAAATTARKTCAAPGPVHVGLLTGHAHEWLTRFSIWHDKLDGTSELVYETHNWEEPGNAGYRDGVANPSLPMTPGQDWGATNGYLFLEAGESISFECAFQNTQNRAIRFGDTAGDEMCNVFGLYYPSMGSTWNCL